MMGGLDAILLREAWILRRKIWKLAASWALTPLLYFLAFAWAGKGRVMAGGMDYRAFLLPGLAAMSAMNHGYALSMDLNISRFYWKTFDEIRTAPVSDLAYVLGEGLSGAARGLMASLVVFLMGWLFRVPFAFGPLLVLSLTLTALVFAFLAISTALLARNHSDQAFLSNFVITPMAFLCGTLFPLDAYPHWLQGIMQVLPLTPATRLVRASAWGYPLPLGSMATLLILGTACFVGAALVVRRTHESFE